MPAADQEPAPRPRLLPRGCKPVASHGDPPKPSTRLTLKRNNLRKRAVNVHANDSHTVAPSLSLEKREPAGNTTHTDPRSQRIRESRKGGQITNSSSQLICQRRPARTSRAPGAHVPDGRTKRQSTKISRTCEAPPLYIPDNGYAERLIGSIRRECIDHVIVFGECHLRHLLRSYLNYYDGTRTHLSLDKDARFRAPSRPLVAYSPVRSWVACITNTYGLIRHRDRLQE